MRLQFPVNQAECLRRGIDAPSSAFVLTFDPALDLSEEERGLLADLIGPDGFLVNKLPGYVPGFTRISERISHLVTIKGSNFGLRPLYEPSLEAVKVALADFKTAKAIVKDAEAEDAAQQHAREVERIKKLDPAPDRVESWGESVVLPPDLASSGQRTIYIQFHDVPVFGQSLTPTDAALDALGGQEGVTRFNEAVAERRTERERIKADQTQVIFEKMRQDKAQLKAERDVYIARLPEVTRKRFAEGYVADLDDQIRKLMIEDSGLISCEDDGFWLSYPFDPKEHVLSDAAFEALETLKRRAPEGSEVVLYRQVEYESHDRDNTPGDETGRTRVIARVEWQRAGVSAQVYIVLASTHAE